MRDVRLRRALRQCRRLVRPDRGDTFDRRLDHPGRNHAACRSTRNVVVRTDCGTETGERCRQADAPTPTSVLADWGSSIALIDNGMKLAPTVWCGISQGASDRLTTTDHRHAARTVKRSIGAHEYDGSCSP